MADRSDAQRRVNRIRAFQAELAAIERDAVVSLTPAQRQAIADYHERLVAALAAAHDVDRSEAAGQLSRGMRLASFFAALALTAAVYSLVARFWGRLDLPMQASLLCAFPLAALIAVELSARRERSLYIAGIFAIAAYGCYWLAVTVLGELVNLPLTPLPIWGGVAFGIALAIPYGFRLIFGAALGALLLAVAGSAFAIAGLPWTLAIEFPEIITAAALVLALLSPSVAPLHASFAAVTRVVGFGAAFFGLLMLSSIGSSSLLPLSARVSESLYQVLMLVVSVTTLTVAVRRRWTETVYVAAAALTVFLFVRFTDWFWTAVPRYVFFLLLAAIAFAWLVALRRLRTRL